MKIDDSMGIGGLVYLHGGLAVISADTYEDAIKLIIESDILEECKGKLIKNLRELRENEILYQEGAD